jgi:hypothetical protein
MRRSFLGQDNHFQCFIHQLAEITGRNGVGVGVEVGVLELLAVILFGTPVDSDGAGETADMLGTGVLVGIGCFDSAGDCKESGLALMIGKLLFDGFFVGFGVFSLPSLLSFSCSAIKPGLSYAPPGSICVNPSHTLVAL